MLKILWSKISSYVYGFLGVFFLISFLMYRSSLIQKGRNIEKAEAQKIHDQILSDKLVEKDVMYQKLLKDQENNFKRRLKLNENIQKNNDVVKKAKQNVNRDDICFDNEWVLYANSILADTNKPLF